MKVLFVCSGNHKGYNDYGISPIIKAQGDSLEEIGIKLEYFPIVGSGHKNYFKHIRLLREYTNSNDFDICHAHYSLCGYVAALSNINKPIVVSLMGSDIKSSYYFKFLIGLFNYLTWDEIIVKSKSLANNLSLEQVHIIPNGVNFNIFKPSDTIKCQSELNWDIEKKHILFPANPNRHEKNFNLAKLVFSHFDEKKFELHSLDNVPHEFVPKYINASNVVLLTSLWEGSPNVIKEAMACNRPIVSTDVGDVRDVISTTKGCYVCSYDPIDIKNRVLDSIVFDQTNGRDKIDYLDSNTIAMNLLEIYLNMLKK